MATLIKIDRNGSKHYEGWQECDRCDGRGLYAIGIENGRLRITHVDNGICHKCGGSGKVWKKWIERTPEYQAKLDARREAKWKAEADKRAKEMAEALAQQAKERAEKEALIKAQKAVSQYQGEVGKRVTIKMAEHRTVMFETQIGWKTVRMCIHIMKDEQGNVYTWKTQNALGIGTEDEKGYWNWTGIEDDRPFVITGTIKEHKEYKEEKQTVLTRCKVKEIIGKEA